MPFIPLNAFNPAAPIEGCTNADNDRMERDLLAMMAPRLRDIPPSRASLMLADIVIPYPTADEAQVAMLDRTISMASLGGIILIPHEEVDAAILADALERSRDARAREWLASLPAAQG